MPRNAIAFQVADSRLENAGFVEILGAFQVDALSVDGPYAAKRTAWTGGNVWLNSRQ
jgi:hypothetical protein